MGKHAREQWSLPEPHTSKLTFHQELISLLNRYSRENVSNTPDFILANYLEECLQVFERTIAARGTWWGWEWEKVMDGIPANAPTEDQVTWNPEGT